MTAMWNKTRQLVRLSGLLTSTHLQDWINNARSGPYIVQIDNNSRSNSHEVQYLIDLKIFLDVSDLSFLGEKNDGDWEQWWSLRNAWVAGSVVGEGLNSWVGQGRGWEADVEDEGLCLARRVWVFVEQVKVAAVLVGEIDDVAREVEAGSGGCVPTETVWAGCEPKVVGVGGSDEAVGSYSEEHGSGGCVPT